MPGKAPTRSRGLSVRAAAGASLDMIKVCYIILLFRNGALIVGMRGERGCIWFGCSAVLRNMWHRNKPAGSDGHFY